MTRLFELRKPETPWGDYGDVLWHGMSAHLGRRFGRLRLERTGPLVPPISFPAPWNIVVTDLMKRDLISENLSGISFRPVIKARIVKLEWEAWDIGADEPQFYPEEGEPEGYILDRPHDRRLAKSIGPMWELLPVEVNGLRSKGGSVVPAKYRGDDLCIADDFGGAPVLSERAREVLLGKYEKWVALRAVRLRSAG